MLSNNDLSRHIGKYYGKYSGEVTDNSDTDQAGKIKVKVPTIFGKDLEVTARPCLPYAHFFVPDVGVKVWIEFEGGDPQFPIWVGTWYPPTAVPPKAQITPPDNRVIQTPSGHTIEIMDKSGEERIVIKHMSNSFVSIDKDGSVIISNQKGSNLFLNSKDEEATLMEQHGNLLTMNSDGSVLVSKDGLTLELKGDTARVIAKNIVLQGTVVQLGNQAMEPTIMGQTFAQMWTTFGLHTHPTALGPSGPPVPPALPLLPGNGLTSAVLVK